jgi:hypothetical protein
MTRPGDGGELDTRGVAWSGGRAAVTDVERRSNESRGAEPSHAGISSGSDQPERALSGRLRKFVAVFLVLPHAASCCWGAG